jgi:hypothetical protein
MTKASAIRSPSASDVRLTRRPVRSTGGAAALVACTFFAGAAFGEGANDKEVCIRSYEQSQRFRKVNKLVEAKAELVTCQDSCPAKLRADCSQWVEDTEKRTPTIVVDAQDAAGHALGAVRVVVDEQLLAMHIDERPIPVDPGDHVVRFESQSLPPVVMRLVLREGEKNRRISVRFDPQRGASPTPSQAPVESPATPASAQTATAGAPSTALGGPPATAPGPVDAAAPAQEHAAPIKIPVAPVVAAGVGLLGVAGFLYFGAGQRAGDLTGLDACKPHCVTSQSDGANGSVLVMTDLSLVVAVGGLGAAAYLYFFRHDGTPAAARASRPIVAAWPTAGGALGSVSGEF